MSGEQPDETETRVETRLRAADLIAVNTLGQFAEHPRVAALREFITDWYVSYLSIDEARGQPEAGPQERLSKTGDNLEVVGTSRCTRLRGLRMRWGARSSSCSGRPWIATPSPAVRANHATDPARVLRTVSPVRGWCYGLPGH